VTLTKLKALFAGAGCADLFVKYLAENDNSKNQVYVGPGFQALNLIPHEEIRADGKVGNSTFKARLNFGWLLPTGHVAIAPFAQLILYPQYPEVRFSGFLRGCKQAPSDLMVGRAPGRVLFLGVTSHRGVVGFVAARDSKVAAELRLDESIANDGRMHRVELPGALSEAAARQKLLQELGRISRLGWINSKQLDKRGALGPCNAPQCGGFTLEAELGVPKNSAAEPDYLGWEVKQHSVSNFDRPASGASITLMTPEPTGGFYKEKGPAAFVKEFGYADKTGRQNRLNFGGVHKVDVRHALTGLTLRLVGYDIQAAKITDANGELALVDNRGRIAASWAFSGLLAHWSRKHTKAAYVPSKSRLQPSRQYCYGPKIRLAQGTDSLRLLRTFALGVVFYDPGIKLENIDMVPKVKRRSQFRIASKNILELYESMEVVDLAADG